MASQLFCLALLAVSVFGHDLTSRQQYVPQQDYSSQSYGLYNQQPASSMQGQLPYMNYILQKQSHYLPYVAQKMQFLPAHAQQWIPQLRVPTGVEGQVNTPVNQLWNREQAAEGPQVHEKLEKHDKHSKVHSKKDKHSFVQESLNQVRPEEQQQQQQDSVNYRNLVNERQVQDNTVLSQIRDVPVQDNTVLSQIRDVPVQEQNLPYQVRDVNQRRNILGNTEGLIQSHPEIRDVNQLKNLPVQGLAQPNFEVTDVNQRVNLPVQGFVRPTFAVNQVRDVNQRFNILANTEGLIRSYPEIIDVCQRINLPVHVVDAVRDVNQILNIVDNTEGLIRSYPEIVDVCQRINMLVQGLVQQNFEVTDVNQRVNLPFQGLVRPIFEASELSQRVPFGQSNIDGTLRYNNVLAPRYQSASQYQFQPMSQVYPARQNILSLLGLRPTRPAMQVAVDPTQQIWEQNVPTYFTN